MINKKENENYLEFADRITQKLLYGSIGYKEWSESLIGDVIYSEENLRRCSVFLNMFLEKIKDEDISSFDKNLINNFQNIKEDIITERNKLQQEKVELNEKYRWQARNELYQERIINAIEKLPSFEKPLYLYTVKNENKVGSTALLCLSDFHAGSTYEIKGLYGEVVNKYSFEIMEQRLWSIIKKIEDDDIVFDSMVVSLLGDCFENILRISSLSKLREPVVDTVIKFSEFISEWLVELYKIIKVPINVVTVGGNHDINRVLNQKPQLEEENLTKLVVEFLKLRLKDFSEITIDDYTDVAVKNIKNTNIMFQHGEDKDIELTSDGGFVIDVASASQSIELDNGVILVGSGLVKYNSEGEAECAKSGVAVYTLESTRDGGILAGDYNKIVKYNFI